MGAERLQKVLAAAGIGSRRACEALIAQGRVSIDGLPVTTQGVRIDPRRHDIRIDGCPIALNGPPTFSYLLLYKPVGYVSTVRDPEGRPSVLDLLDRATHTHRLYPVGRLDYDSEGLLLLTDDGELTHRVTHPRFGIAKAYLAAVSPPPSPALLDRLGRGVLLDGRMTAPSRFERDGTWNGWPALRILLHEGRTRQIRRMLAQTGVDVIRLARTDVGPLSLGSLRPGAWRPLTPAELRALRRAVALEEA